MAQESLPKPGALSSAFDQTRDVRQHHTMAIDLGHAQLRIESGERVVRHARRRRRHGPQERGLAGVGRSDQAHVGDQLQLQAEPPLLAGQARLGELRRALDGAAEVHVAAAARAAAGHDRLGAGGLEVGHDRAVRLVEHDGPDGHGQPKVGAGAARLAGLGAGPAVLGPPLPAADVRDERGGVGSGVEDHGATAAAVASVGPAAGHEGLPAEGCGASAAVTGANAEARDIDEGAVVLDAAVRTHRSGVRPGPARRRPRRR